MKRLLALLAILFFLGAPAFAAEPKPDAEGFVPVSGAMMQPGETIPANRLVAAAYGFIFAALAVYVASVVARSRRVEAEMRELQRKLEAKNG
jgi:hypothetical protein